MAIDVHYEVAGKRMVGKMPEILPRIGETILLTPFGRVRAHRYTVARIEWSVSQEESPAYFNRPRQCVIYLEPEGEAAEED